MWQMARVQASASPLSPLCRRRRCRHQLQHAGHCRGSEGGQVLSWRSGQRACRAAQPVQYCLCNTAQQSKPRVDHTCAVAHQASRGAPHTTLTTTGQAQSICMAAVTCAVAHHACRGAPRRLQLVGRGGPNLAVAEAARKGGLREHLLQGPEACGGCAVRRGQLIKARRVAAQAD